MSRRATFLLAALLCGPAPAADAPCDADCLDAKGLPVPTYRKAPGYPREAHDRGVEGCVVASFEILPSGKADKYAVLDSQPKGVFDAVTLQAINDWTFRVPQRPGRYAQRIDYRMKDSKAKLSCMEAPGFDALNGAAAAAAQSRQLRVLQQVTPAYQGVAPEGGCVTVQFVIKYDGFVGDVKVLEARPAALAEPTVAALKQWQFQSFPPPDLQTVQTFNFAPDQMRMPDTYVRTPLAKVGEDGTIGNQGCGKGKNG